MREIHEVTVFTNGDSEKISTWSNVPYFLTKTLISKGIKVNRVNIQSHSLLTSLYNRTVWKLLNKIKKNYFTTYFHSYINHLEVQWRIKKAARRYKNSDASIFLTFSHTSLGYSDAPVVLFCDWTSDYYFKYFLNRPPLFLERYTIKRQDKKVREADLVVSLFPSVTEYMQTYYKTNNIFYLGNVVNSELSVPAPEVIRKKLDSADILFIGNKKYIEGARCLIRAHSLLRETIPNCQVHIIGMESSTFDELPEGVTCYGYLDKSNDEQRVLYYSLLQHAKVIVNTTEKWGAFSSMIEAMYFYNPVITTPYKEFVQTFGNDIRFGYYCESNSAELLHDNLVRIFQDPEYQSLCMNAHEMVKLFTWDAYIDKLLEKIIHLPQKSGK